MCNRDVIYVLVRYLPIRGSLEMCIQFTRACITRSCDVNSDWIYRSDINLNLILWYVTPRYITDTILFKCLWWNCIIMTFLIDLYYVIILCRLYYYSWQCRFLLRGNDVSAVFVEWQIYRWEMWFKGDFSEIKRRIFSAKDFSLKYESHFFPDIRLDFCTSLREDNSTF